MHLRANQFYGWLVQMKFKSLYEVTLNQGSAFPPEKPAVPIVHEIFEEHEYLLFDFQH